jgi:pimeloyl-ACP methyl ester carboxylesterase
MTRWVGPVALLFAAAAPASGGEELITVATRPGVTQSFLLVRPSAAAPIASVILFAGGTGALMLSADGIGALRGNFLVRNRARFADQGLLVAVVDAPSDRDPGGLVRFRATREHAADVAAVIAALRKLVDVPVWVVGTSMGTVSAANAAARLRDGGPDGLVLTSSITRPGRGMGETVDDVALETIAIPTLVVHHRYDRCPLTPYRDAVGLVKAFKRAPRVELLAFEGGDAPRSEPCEAFSAHGYLGLDAQVVTAIAAWIKGASASR